MNESIQLLQNAIAKDRQIRAIAKRINRGSVGYDELYSYASLLSKCIARVMNTVLPPEAWDSITVETLVSILSPMMQHSHGLINEAYKIIQEGMNRANGVGFNSVLVEFDDRQERLSGMAERAVELTFEQATDFLPPAIENFNLSLVDEDMQANADFQATSGLKVIVKRTATPGCCEWCGKLAGEYDYSEIRNGSEVWARHRGCRCTLTFDSQKTVWGGPGYDRWKWSAASDKQRARNREADMERARNRAAM